MYSTRKNLEAAKNIVGVIKDAIKSKKIPSKKIEYPIEMGIERLEEYSDAGELQRWQSVEIWHTYPHFYEDETFQTVVGEALDEYVYNDEDDDTVVYFTYKRQKVADRDDKYFSNIYPRTKKNIYVNIHEKIDEKYRKEVHSKVSQTEEFKKYNEEAFEQFKKLYTYDYYKENFDYNEFLEKIVEKAKEIRKKEKKQNNDVVENMREFLHKYGIFLLIEEKHDILDGICGYVGEKKMPTIILYVDIADIKNLRRCFFTIAHELYHLLYSEGEDLANKFAGAFLVSDVFDTLEGKLDITDTDKMKKLLKKYREELGVSFECIINSLFDSKKIGSKQQSELLRYKWRYIDKGDIDLGEEEKWIYNSLGIK